MRVMDQAFKLEHMVTIGVEFGSFVISVDEKIVKLQIWDTAGQESFRSVTRIFYKGAHIVFLCYDITREYTFANLKSWLTDIKEHAGPNVVIYLIGSKADLEDEREVTKEMAQEFCQAENIANHFETSSKTGLNVENVFALAAKDMYVRACVSEEAEK